MSRWPWKAKCRCSQGWREATRDPLKEAEVLVAVSYRIKQLIIRQRVIPIETMYEKSLRHLELGELDEAEDALKLYLKANPTDAMAHNKLGIVFAKRSNRVEAKRCFHEALRQDVNLVHALNNLGNIAREEGELERAIEYYQKAILIDPDYSLPHNNLGVIYKELNRYTDFVREIKTAKRLENKKVLNPEKKKTFRDLLAKIWTKKR